MCLKQLSLIHEGSSQLFICVYVADEMKVKFLCAFILCLGVAETRGIRRRKLAEDSPDYEASGDYFELTVAPEIVTASTKKLSSSEESSDDGVTCSDSNFTNVLAGYELENHVLVIFKINVSANERELVL